MISMDKKQIVDLEFWLQGAKASVFSALADYAKATGIQSTPVGGQYDAKLPELMVGLDRHLSAFIEYVNSNAYESVTIEPMEGTTKERGESVLHRAS